MTCKSSLDRDTDEPYFLGSVVLVKEKGIPAAEVIDGQQRLTTLTILFSVLRDLATRPGTPRGHPKFVEEPEVVVGRPAGEAAATSPGARRKVLP